MGLPSRAEEGGELLAIVLVANAGGQNKNKFIDLGPLYKSTILNKETGNKEVPAFVKMGSGSPAWATGRESIAVHKAIIPHRSFKKIFDKLADKLKDPETKTVDLTDDQRKNLINALETGKLRPLNLEHKKYQRLLREGKLEELFNHKQDWEILL